MHVKMKNIGASCVSLFGVDPSITIKKDEDYNLVSTISISRYEGKKIKSHLPEICAALAAVSFHLSSGMGMAYSAVLIAQLELPESEIKATTSEKSWIASILVVVVPVASIICSLLMDSIGRLKTIIVAAIPGVLGWSMIALANNIPLIIIGRLLLGFSLACGTNPAIVYISEIASPSLRGSLMSMGIPLVSTGLVLTYFFGMYLDWRVIAWIGNISCIVPAILCFFVPESPPWLFWKRKYGEAKKSLDWLAKYQPQPQSRSETYSELQMKLLENEQNKRDNGNEKKGDKVALSTVKAFLKPTGYKPIIFFFGLHVCQQFCGIYIIMYYSIQFMQAAGTSIDPYVASIFIGIVRFVMSLVSTALMRKFRRRTLIMISALGMSLCMFTSGFFTTLIQQNKTTLTWVPVVSLLAFVSFSTIGFAPIPFTIMTELFPTEIRSVGYAIGMSENCFLNFISLQYYYTMLEFLGGIVEIQYFFAIIALLGLVYAYIFMPETFNVTMSDLANYYNDHTIYIGHDHSKTEHR
ncbi:unnamed protein product [Brassicogethes aeneus]|uniref:Major facilitator superfamily (MFS) profile domain-containing protein n=1 Tax=Brassicogethes aeneus TaxID=1431903 RepID=A0A9P0AVU0_BRAAE|nr:unnamed protein product [Brassicogethes aeneus]